MFRQIIRATGGGLLLGCIIFLSACGMQVPSYEQLTMYGRITEITPEEYVQMIRSDAEFYIYLGNTSDKNCCKVQADLLAFLEKKNLELVYLDTASEKQVQIRECLEDYLDVTENMPCGVFHYYMGYPIEKYDFSKKDGFDCFRENGGVFIDEQKRIMKIHALDYEKLTQAESDFWIFLGRPTCRQCQAEYAKTIKLLQDENRYMYYLLCDKEYMAPEIYDQVTQIMAGNGVSMLPTIVHIVNGKADAAYMLGNDDLFQLFQETFADANDNYSYPADAVRLEIGKDISQEVSAFREENPIIEVKVSEVYLQTIQEEDFWIYMGAETNSECAVFYQEMEAFLMDRKKNMQYLNTESITLDEREAFELLLKGYGIDIGETEIPQAVFHISKGYVVSRYNVGDEKDMENLKIDYSRRNTKADTYIKNMTFASMKESLEKGEDRWVYMGRASCKDCRAYYPRLVAHLNDVQESISYVITDKDFLNETEMEFMTEFRDKYGIEEVPAIVHIKDGEVIRSYNMQLESDIIDFEEDHASCCSLF